MTWQADLNVIEEVDRLIENQDLFAASSVLPRLESSLGPLGQIRFTELGLFDIEARSQWPEDRRAYLFAGLYLVMGRIFAGYGKYQEARVLLQRSVAHANSFDGAIGGRILISAKLALAGIEFEVGKACTAIAILNGALKDECAETASQDVRRREYLAKAYTLIGDYGSAERELRRAADICGAQDAAAAWSWLNLADFLMIVNRHWEAEPLAARASEIGMALGIKGIVDRATWLRNTVRERMATLFSGEPALSVFAAKSLPTESATKERPAAPTWFGGRPSSCLAAFENVQREFLNQFRNKQFDRAQNTFADITKAFGHAQSELIHARIDVLEGLLLYSSGEYEAAAKLFDRACVSLSPLGLLPDLHQAQIYLTESARKTLGSGLDHNRRSNEDVRKALWQLRSTSDHVLDRIANSIEGEARGIFLLNKWSNRDELLDLEIRELAADWNMGRGRTAAPKLVERLGRILRRVYPPALGARPEIEALWVQELSRRPQDMWTIAFVVLRSCVAVIRLGSESDDVDFGLYGVDRERLRGVVSEFHRTIGQGRHEGDLEKTNSLSELLAVMLGLDQTLRNRPERIRRIRFVPDDQLHGFPFAALRCKAGAEIRYLAQDCAVSIGFNCEMSDDFPTLHDGPALIASVTKGYLGRKALSQGDEEFERVVNWFKRQDIPVIPLRDEAVTREALRQRLRVSRFFHFVGHGRFDVTNPQLTGLLLPEANGAEEVFSLTDILLSRTHIEQAVFANCWGADSYLFPGRWTVSFPSILWRSGVRSILAPLWEIPDDDNTSTSRFYALAATHGKDTALQMLQRALLEREEHPYWWAAFQLYGEVGPLGLRGGG